MSAKDYRCELCGQKLLGKMLLIQGGYEWQLAYEIYCHEQCFLELLENPTVTWPLLKFQKPRKIRLHTISYREMKWRWRIGKIRASIGWHLTRRLKNVKRQLTSYIRSSTHMLTHIFKSIAKRLAIKTILIQGLRNAKHAIMLNSAKLMDGFSKRFKHDWTYWHVGSAEGRDCRTCLKHEVLRVFDNSPILKHRNLCPRFGIVAPEHSCYLFCRKYVKEDVPRCSLKM